MAALGKTVSKLTAPLQRRLHSMIVRGLVKMISDNQPLQLLQVSGVDGELLDNVERLQNYGFTSHPRPDSEAVILAIGGSRTHNIVLAVDDRRYRVKSLESGEVAIYDDLGQSIELKRSGININSNDTVNITASKVRMAVESLEVTGSIKDMCDLQDNTMADMRLTYNSHTHGGDSGGETTTPNETI